MAFKKQNYNILGWMWVPLAFFAVADGQWVLTAFTWLGASFASITVIFIAVPLLFAHAFEMSQYWLPLLLLPAIVKILLQFLPMLKGNELKKGIFNSLKLIGLTSQGARYKRTSKYIGTLQLYLLSLYIVGFHIFITFRSTFRICYLLD